MSLRSYLLSILFFFILILIPLYALAWQVKVITGGIISKYVSERWLHYIAGIDFIGIGI